MSEPTEKEEEDRFEVGFKIRNGKHEFSFGFKAEEPLDILEEIDKAMNPPIDNRGV